MLLMETILFSLIHLPKTARYLKGKKLHEKTLSGAIVSINKELEQYKPPEGPAKHPLEIDGSTWAYRSSLARTLFYKFFVGLASKIDSSEVGKEIKSAGQIYDRPISTGQQIYNSYPDELPVSGTTCEIICHLCMLQEKLNMHMIWNVLLTLLKLHLSIV